MVLSKRQHLSHSLWAVLSWVKISCLQQQMLQSKGTVKHQCSGCNIRVVCLVQQSKIKQGSPFAGDGSHPDCISFRPAGQLLLLYRTLGYSDAKDPSILGRALAFASMQTEPLLVTLLLLNRPTICIHKLAKQPQHSASLHIAALFRSYILDRPSESR